MSEGLTVPGGLSLAERRRAVCLYREAGRRFWEIPDLLRQQFPGQVSESYGESSAYRDYTAVLRMVRDDTMAHAEVVRQEEDARLTALWQRYYAPALAGDDRAFDRCMQLMRQRSRIWALDKLQAANTMTVDEHQRQLLLVLHLIQDHIYATSPTEQEQAQRFADIQRRLEAVAQLIALPAPAPETAPALPPDQDAPQH